MAILLQPHVKDLGGFSVRRLLPAPGSRDLIEDAQARWSRQAMGRVPDRISGETKFIPLPER